MAFKSRSTFHLCLRLFKNKQLLNLWPLKSISSQQCGVLGQSCTLQTDFHDCEGGSRGEGREGKGNPDISRAQQFVSVVYD